MDGGEPITGQAALIVWLNSWLIEWEMELGVGAVPWGRARASAGEEALSLGRVPSRRALPAPSPRLVPGAHSFSEGGQLITVSTSLWGSKYSRINTESSETSVYSIAAAEIFTGSRPGGPSRLGFPAGESFYTSHFSTVLFFIFFLKKEASAPTYRVALASN